MGGDHHPTTVAVIEEVVLLRDHPVWNADGGITMTMTMIMMTTSNISNSHVVVHDHFTIMTIIDRNRPENNRDVVLATILPNSRHSNNNNGVVHDRFTIAILIDQSHRGNNRDAAPIRDFVRLLRGKMAVARDQ